MIESRAITSTAEWLEWRKADVTASDIAALFGLHPHKTLLELWGEKSGLIDSTKRETGAMRRGRILEPSVAAAVAEERPEWIISAARTYLRDTNLRIGGTPDFKFVDRGARGHRDRERGVLQAKTVSPKVFAEQWSEDSPPFWVVLQIVAEMMLWDSSRGAVAALIIDPYRFDVAIYEVERHKGTEQKIRYAVRKFWKFVDDGVQPPADFERDSAILSALYPRERPDAPELDLTGDNEMPALLRARAGQLKYRAAAQGLIDKIDAALKSKLGFSEAAFGRDWRVTWKTQHHKESYRPAHDRRVLRVSDKQGNQEYGTETGEERHSSAGARPEDGRGHVEF